MIHATRWESVVQVWLGEKININYTYIGELSKLNAQVSLSHQCLPIALTGKSFFFLKAHTCFISNWPLALMHAASRENRRHVWLVTMLHEASEKGFFSAVAPHSVSFSIQGLRSTAGLDLCHWQGRFSPAQHTVGKLKRDSLSIYLRRPLPRPALQGF